MPNQLQMGVYTGVTHYLKAVKAAGTTYASAVMAKMREIPINDPFVKDGRIREDGKALRAMYLMRTKKSSDSKSEWDFYDLVSTVSAEEASRPLSESECRLVKK